MVDPPRSRYGRLWCPRHHRTRWVGRAPPPPECADAPAADPGCAVDASLASLVKAGECALLFAPAQSAAFGHHACLSVPEVSGPKFRLSMTDPSMKTQPRRCSQGCWHEWGRLCAAACDKTCSEEHLTKNLSCNCVNMHNFVLMCIILLSFASNTICKAVTSKTF